jgi:hypothetical protein
MSPDVRPGYADKEQIRPPTAPSGVLNGCTITEEARGKRRTNSAVVVGGSVRIKMRAMGVNVSNSAYGAVMIFREE